MNETRTATPAPRPAAIPATDRGPSLRSPRRRWLRILLVLCALTLLAFVFAGSVGSVAIPLTGIPAAVRALLHGDDSLQATLLGLRLGRAALAFLVGGGLALAGAMMQALLRNPLADPYVLGVSGGAAVGALLALLLGVSAWLTDAAAFAGALGISTLLYFLARRDLRGGMAVEGGGSSTLLLTGVILSSGCMALVTLMLSVAPESRLRGMVFWLIGDLTGSTPRLMPALVLIAVLALVLRRARALNVLALHAEAAETLGVKVAGLRQVLFIGASLLTASAVSAAGSVGFVGLVVPHALRFALGPDHRLLLPASVLCGGAFLVVADTLARTLLAPQQLPVGAITALIGVPVFLFQLHRLRR